MGILISMVENKPEWVPFTWLIIYKKYSDTCSCMKWNIYIYIFNTVNNKEREHGQWSVVWLKCSYPCLHQLHVLSTAFSWWPLSSFSLWIILLPYPSPSLIFFYWINISVWQVPGSIGVGAHGWRAWVFQPWGRDSL